MCGKQYNNQGWVYNDKGELVTKGSNYFKIVDMDSPMIFYKEMGIALFIVQVIVLIVIIGNKVEITT